MSGAPSHEHDVFPSGSSPSASPALPAEAHHLDFWLGDWELTWEGGGRGRNRITRILDGQVIQEQFTQVATGPEDSQLLRGLSVSVYASSLGVWRQTWVDSTGNYMEFVGGYADEKLTLSMERIVDGRPTTYRMVFSNIATQSLDWEWERSEDGGQSWQLLWRIHYQRHADVTTDDLEAGRAS